MITKMRYKEDRNKYWINIDNQYCTSLSKDVVELFELREGLDIDCDKLRSISGVSKIEYLDKEECEKKYQDKEERVRVYIRKVDTTRYIDIRKIIFDTLKNRMGLKVGQIITYDKLLYDDKFI